MLDLVIRGGTVVTPSGIGNWDVGVSGGRIAALGEPGALGSNDIGRVIDAKGKIVMPGGIDPHVHCAWHLPLPDGTAGLTAGPDVVSRAALYGGTTTMIDFAVCPSDQLPQPSIAKRDEVWKGNCYCDYAYHVMLQGEVPPQLIAALPEMVQAGYPTVKIFTTDITPSRRGRMVRFGEIWDVFKTLSAAGGLGVIHAEDNDIVMHMYGKLIAEGRAGFENMAEVHNTLSEDLSFRRIIRLAEHVPGMALYMMHVSAANGVAAIADARARGFPIYGETLHQYMLYTSEDYKRPNGQIYHTYPSLKSAADQKALWDGTLSGAINCVATDEICCSLAVKVLGKRIDDTTGGNAGVEPRLGVIYTETVGKRGHSLSQYVDLVSSNAAKVMGLYPRKGAIAVGSDADITLLDPSEKRTVRVEDLHETDYSPWEGKVVDAWPVMTILRGKVVVENGQFQGALSDGQYLHRKIPDWIRSGPAL